MNWPSPFKVCSFCGKEWPTRDDLLNDCDVVLNGYQPDLEDLEQGLFLFTHLKKESCGTTFALNVSQFSDLVKRPVLAPRRMGSEECPGYCLRRTSFDPCPVFCECAYVREVIPLLRRKASEED